MTEFANLMGVGVREGESTSACSFVDNVDNNLCLPILLIDNLRSGIAMQLLHEHTGRTTENQAGSALLGVSEVSWRLCPRGGWLILEVPSWFDVCPFWSVVAGGWLRR